MKSLSPKQENILKFMREFINERDYPPSIRDIQEGCDISSTSVVDYNLKALETKGFIKRDREVSRGIELLTAASGAPTVSVPIIGTIAAASPSGAVDGQHRLRQRLRGTRRDDARPRERLRSQGARDLDDDALVNDGDIVIPEATSVADDGDMVAAWLKKENEATLKKFYREGDRVRLQPANSTMKPIFTAADNVEVQGKVLATIGRRD